MTFFHITIYYVDISNTAYMNTFITFFVTAPDINVAYMYYKLFNPSLINGHLAHIQFFIPTTMTK